MELKGNKGEWSELYTALKLMADGEIYAADEYMEKVDTLVFPVLKILREEKENKIDYLINGKIILINPKTEEIICEIDRVKFMEAAQIVFNNIAKLNGRSINVSRFEGKDELVNFLKAINISTLKAKSTDKSDITIQIHDHMTGSRPILGFSIKSMLGSKSTLFNPAAGTNFIFNIDNIKLNAAKIIEFNNLTYGLPKRLSKRISSLEELGGEFNFLGIQSEMLELNLRLIDGDLPEILANMLKMRFVTGCSKVKDLIQKLDETNPLEYNLAHKHPFYKYKVIKFLYDTALGMTPETIWNGEIKANGGIIVVKNDGDILAYHTYHKSKFEEYLLNNTFLEQPSTSEDENLPGTPKTKENYPGKSIKPFMFGWLYTEDNDQLRFKLNLQVRFTK